MICASYAKINLGLHLLGKRPDGYHDILTVFQEISLHDTVTCRPAGAGAGISITCSRPDVPCDESNTVWRAFRLFCERTGVRDGIEIDISKVLPPGGGLGGGSSNAAAVLCAANRIWHTGLSEDELCLLAAEVGSDVPFFIRGGSMLGEGRGELLSPLEITRRYYLLLVCPGIHVSTAQAYNRARIALTKEEKITTFRALFPELRPAVLRERLVNDFEATVFADFPVLAGIKEKLYTAGACYAGMSGSGSTMFGMFNHREAARSAGEQLETENGWICHTAVPVYRR